MLQIKQITEANQRDIRIKNEPFKLWGKMIPLYTDQTWRHQIETFPAETISEMCFPDEKYDFQQMKDNTVFFGAYDQDTCIGLAVVQKGFFRYDYLYDLKVNHAYRQQGVAHRLIEAAAKWAQAQGHRGIYTIGQDNNLSACLFYLKAGFRIGGLDTEVYNGTQQEGIHDILFYLDAP